MIHSLIAAALVVSPSFVEIAQHQKVSVDLHLRLERAALTEKRPSPDVLLVAQFDRPISDDVIKQLERQGVTFERVRGHVARVGSFYGARVSAEGLAALVAHRDCRKLLPPSPLKVLATPLVSEFDLVHRLTTAWDVWSQRDAQGQRLTGHGVVIADMDSGIDVFHPMFFKADGGAFSWIDVNRNGAFDPGVDAVDLDGDGVADADETLLALGGDVVEWGTITSTPTPPFEPGREWLFADSNGNGVRDYGPTAGFVDSTPGFGEPLFVTDDVDQDGQLQVHEKLLRLGTSKIRAVVRTFSGVTYERGTNLIQTPVHPSVSHGTGTCGILAGGVYGRTQIQGVAPDAELIMIDQYPAAGDPSLPVLTDVAAADLVKVLGADILVHEYGTHVFMFADGSDPWEQYIDQLSADGMVQVAATHNFAGSNGKAQVTLSAGETRDLALDLLSYGVPGYDVETLFLTLRWLGGVTTDIDAFLVSPSNVTIGLNGDQNVGSLYVYTDTGRSSQGTSMIGSSAFAWNGSILPLELGTWTLRLTNTTASAREVHISIADGTGYAYLTQFGEAVTEAGTLAWPSTADSAISVGASAGNVPDPGEPVDALKLFSGRGPRIDGAMGIDIVAPEDHYTASPSVDSNHGDYMLFGGTSGATPQVAGAIALLLQAEPSLTPAQVKARIHATAREDTLTGVTPNDAWGYGRLATFRLVTQADPSWNSPPSAILAVPATVEPGQTVVLDASGSTDAEDEPQGLTFRWDVGYDGTWDHETIGDPMHSASFYRLGRVSIKLEVQDSAGATTQTVAIVNVRVKPTSGDPGDPGGGGCNCSDAQSPRLVWLCIALAVTTMRRRYRR